MVGIIETTKINTSEYIGHQDTISKSTGCAKFWKQSSANSTRQNLKGSMYIEIVGLKQLK